MRNKSILLGCAIPFGLAMTAGCAQSKAVPPHAAGNNAEKSKDQSATAVAGEREVVSAELPVPQEVPAKRTELKVQTHALSHWRSPANSILKLRDGSVDRVPHIAGEPREGRYDRIKTVGDFAWEQAGGGYALLIASGKAAVLSGKIVDYADRDISKLIAKQDAFSSKEMPVGSFVLVETADRSYAVVNLAYAGYLEQLNGSTFVLTWIHQPDGSATFPKDALLELARRGEQIQGQTAAAKPPIVGIAILRSLSEENATVMDFQKRAIVPVNVKQPEPAQEPLERLKQHKAYLEQVARDCDLAYDGTFLQLVSPSEKLAYLGQGKLSDFPAGRRPDFRERRRAEAKEEDAWEASAAVGSQCRPDAVLRFQTRNGNYVLIRVLERDKQQIKLHWAYQPDGSPRFPDIPILQSDLHAPQKSAPEINHELHQLAHTPVTAEERQVFEIKMQRLIAAGGDINALDPHTGSAPLHAAVVYGSTETIEVLVSLGAEVDIRSKIGVTPLQGAASMGQLDICEALLRLGADANLKSADGLSTLQFAVRANEPNPEIIDLIRKHSEQELSLLDAAESGDIDAVTSALQKMEDADQKKAEDINQTDPSGQTPLFLAAQNGHLKVCRVLLDHGADVSLRGKPEGYQLPMTPLQIAIVKRHPEVAKLLLEQQEYTPKELAEALSEAVTYADASSCQILLTTPIPKDEITKVFRIVLMSGSPSVVDAFVQHGLELPLWTACQLNRIDTIRELIAAGSDVNGRDFQGTPPLHYAIQQGNLEAVKLLLEHGADVNATAKGLNDRTPLHIATASPEIVQLLIAKGAQVNALMPITFETPLYFAVLTNQLAAAELLLKNGANPNRSDLITNAEDKKRVRSYISMVKDKKDNQEMMALLKMYGVRE